MNNPRARRNQRRPGAVARLRARLDGDGEVLDASTPEELEVAVRRFQAAEIDVLGVNGGDGTGHVVLTAFARAYGSRPLPRVLLLRGGAMNTVAHGHGIGGTPDAILKSVLEQRRRGSRSGPWIATCSASRPTRARRGTGSSSEPGRW